PGHHTDGKAGVARRRAGARLRYARRRSAGPVAAVLLARAPHRAEPAGRHRRAGLALDVVSVVVRAACLGAGRAGRRVPARPGHAWRAAAPRPRGPRCRAVGARPALRGRAGPGKRAAVRCRESAWSPGIRRWALTTVAVRTKILRCPALAQTAFSAYPLGPTPEPRRR